VVQGFWLDTAEGKLIKYYTVVNVSIINLQSMLLWIKNNHFLLPVHLNLNLNLGFFLNPILILV
jgi:hypothetical protein